MLTEKKRFRVPSFRTESGRVLRELVFGYETYGRLAPSGDNAILVCHYFSGNSHCAGIYNADDPAPGYWDAIIGPGKPIDTERWFVVSADTPCNVNSKDPMVVTVGPSSTDPDTGRPYGSGFPVVGIRDFVRLQKALLEHLQVRRLWCVTGPSMGAMQTFEWGAQFPGMVERLIPVCGAGLHAEPFFIAEIDLWAAPILMDPAWKGGDYHGGTEPQAGVFRALEAITVTARSPAWAEALFGRKWERADADPLANAANRYLVESTLEQIVQDRGRYAEASHIVHLVRGCCTYDVNEGGGSIAAIRAPTLIVYGRSDTVMYPAYSRRAAAELRAQGTPVELVELDADGGHLDCLFEIGRVGPRIAEFLRR